MARTPWDRRKRDTTYCTPINPGARPRHRPIGFTGPLAELVRAYHTVNGLAKVLKVSRWTISRWARGMKPARQDARRLLRLALSHGMTAQEIAPIIEGRGSFEPQDWQ